MNLVQRIKLQKQFSEWCRLHRIPVAKNTAYKDRVFKIFKRAWEKKKK